MICGRCSLELSPGSSHADPLACVDALRHALEAATLCSDCHELVPARQILHARCLATSAAKHGAALGTSVAERKILEWFSSWGKTEDAPKRGGKRFKS